MIKRPLFMTFLVALAGCSDPMTEAIASRDTLAYAAANDARDKPAFTIQVGTSCRVGKISFGKVDAYTEVVCGDKKGWVLEVDNLKSLMLVGG
ncbi:MULTISPECIES: hypothetical protein [Chromobacterium]|uniref:Lipoprotein n=1 Tax=Chromobacterium rhizoryzae TaxID=1778675 RepID=A0AAD0W8I8_9NEIS|nr:MULTISPECIES: hypothetical protein [Chromobacterium]AXT47410.1 hypothetical protein D1345_14975 [Chromobacterium rhizoryzae]MDH0342461.1 hypothetical protein [Chromobacterium haemolyticum]QOD81246.1 hypothetical protein IEZ30_15045 [Chromobacterium haemolyticum]